MFPGEIAPHPDPSPVGSRDAVRPRCGTTPGTQAEKKLKSQKYMGNISRNMDRYIYGNIIIYHIL